MKSISPLLLACVLAIPACVNNSTTSASHDSMRTEAKAPVAAPPAAPAPPSKPATPTSASVPGLTFPVSAGDISAPFVLTNGCISQATQSDIATAGKATFAFNIPTAGNYVIKGMVNAPAEEANSFFVSVDTQPEDPMTIWGIEVTTGFEERTVNWRGEDEAVPKVFNLTAGAHKLIIIGREADTQLKSLSIFPAPK